MIRIRGRDVCEWRLDRSLANGRQHLVYGNRIKRQIEKRDFLFTFVFFRHDTSTRQLVIRINVPYLRPPSAHGGIFRPGNESVIPVSFTDPWYYTEEAAKN